MGIWDREYLKDDTHSNKFNGKVPPLDGELVLNKHGGLAIEFKKPLDSITELNISKLKSFNSTPDPYTPNSPTSDKIMLRHSNSINHNFRKLQVPVHAPSKIPRYFFFVFFIIIVLLYLK